MAKAPAVPAVVEETKGSALALSDTSDFAEFAGMGLEEVRSDDLAIPFLRILAQLSPQVNKRDGAYIQGAEPGMLFNTVTNELFDGEKGVLVVPCYFNRRYVEWAPREKGGGYRDSYDVDNPIIKRTTRNEKGDDILPNGNVLTNTMQFFVLLLTDEGPQRCLLTMSSTQLKKGKRWLSIIQNFTGKDKNGKPFPLPAFSHVYRLRTVNEQNDKGNWFGFDVAVERRLTLADDDDHAIFSMGRDFSVSIRKGEVKVRETSLDEASGHTGPAHDDGDNLPF